MAPEISDSQGNEGGFMSLLFQLHFVHCIVVLVFGFPCSSLSLKQGEKLTKKCYNPWPLLFYLLCNVNMCTINTVR